MIDDLLCFFENLTIRSAVPTRQFVRISLAVVRSPFRLGFHIKIMYTFHLRETSSSCVFNLVETRQTTSILDCPEGLFDPERIKSQLRLRISPPLNLKLVDRHICLRYFVVSNRKVYNQVIYMSNFFCIHLCVGWLAPVGLSLKVNEWEVWYYLCYFFFYKYVWIETYFLKISKLNERILQSCLNMSNYREIYGVQNVGQE